MRSGLHRLGSFLGCASSLALSGQSVLLLLEDGCALRIRARGTTVALLRLQEEAAPFAR